MRTLRIGTKSLGSETTDLFRSSLRLTLALFLLCPFLIWIAKIPVWDGSVLAEAFVPLWNSVLQASLSTFLSLIFGFILFRSLQGWSEKRWYRLGEGLLLLPNLIPPLFLALALLSWSSWWGAFPYGLGAVVLAHLLLNSGLVAISLDRLFKAKASGMAEVAWVMGVSPLTFWRRVGWPIMRGDLASLFLFIFALHFTSFSLPLLLSGERVVTLEVAIYDSIRTEGRWDKAVLLAGMQTVFLFAWAVLLPRPLWSRASERVGLSYMSLPRGRFWVALPMVILVAGWLVGTGAGWKTGLESSLYGPIVEGLMTSAALGLGVGLLHLLLFLWVAYVSPHERMELFLNGYLAPSPAIVGFGLLLLPVESSWGRLGLLSVALTLISYPLLYRWLVHSALGALKKQVQVARSLGADWNLVLFEVVWPQASGAILRACGLAALWASGDFALSGILLGDEVTLPLLISGLLGQYRFETAQLLLFPLLALGLALYFLFVGVRRHVAR